MSVFFLFKARHISKGPRVPSDSDRAHIKQREKQTFAWESSRGFSPDSYLETPASFLLSGLYSPRPDPVCV